MIKTYGAQEILEMLGPAETQYGPPIQGNCDDFITQGGDTPETHIIEMGQSSGTFDFSWQMYSLKDRAIVYYQGAVLFDTGCVGGGGTQALSYFGSSTKITVEIVPNCDPAQQGFGTAWNFSVTCPTTGPSVPLGK